jgi:hypothetical protein
MNAIVVAAAIAGLVGWGTAAVAAPVSVEFLDAHLKP